MSVVHGTIGAAAKESGTVGLPVLVIAETDGLTQEVAPPCCGKGLSLRIKRITTSVRHGVRGRVDRRIGW
ncbi:MAG: hypothetical protein P8Z00_07340 [Anaerolineales bacterium]